MASDPRAPPGRPAPPPRHRPRAADPPPARERFVLDSAHVGDIQGAFGTIRQHDESHRTWRSRAWRCWRSSARG